MSPFFFKKLFFSSPSSLCLSHPSSQSTSSIQLYPPQTHRLHTYQTRHSRKPTWGTCAGLILLAEEANAAKKGGQELIGGLDVRVHRNHFGRQVESFTADVELPFLSASGSLSAADGAAPFPGVFIRAPIVEKLLLQGEEGVDARRGEVKPVAVEVVPGVEVATGGEGDPGRAKVEILAVLPERTRRVRGGPVAASTEVEGGDLNNIVAVRQGSIMGTSFHPELTDDIRIHVWWLEEVTKSLSAA